MHRAATRLTLLLAGLAASAALAPATASAAAERIVAAGVDGAEDAPAARVGRPQVSFSPDGDGIADRAWFEVEGAPGDVVRLAAFWRFQGARGVWASPPATIGDDGRVRITWDGTATRTQPPVVDDGTTRTAGDASYTIAVCRDGRCASDDPETTAVALVRRLSVGVATTRTHAAGETVPLVLRTPETSLVAELQREPYRPGAVPLARRRLDPLRPRFRLPHRLRPGMYRLVVTDGAGAARALPLPVRGLRAYDAPRAGTVLVVLPYLTWRAYDQWDDDGDGRPDTWYAAPGGEDGTTSGEPWRVALTGPYESAGAAPPGAERDGRNAWPIGPLLATRRHLQVITDLELGRLPDAAIDRYAGVLVAGHLEYYTDGLYRVLRGYARRGGRMALLSANGLYREVEVSVARGTVTADPRVVRAGGRRDQATLGSGYATCCFAGRPGYRLTAEAVRAVPWLLRGTGLRAGDRFGAAGIEVDGLGPWTPARTVVVGSVDVQGQRERKTAVVTYLPSRVRGGGVLNMGNVFFLRSTVDPAIPEERRRPARRMLLNAWRWLANGTAPALLPPPDDGPRAPAGTRSNPLRLPPPALDEVEPADIPLD